MITRLASGNAVVLRRVPCHNVELKPNTMPAVEGYCVKCKSKRDMKDAKEVEMANGRKAMKGTCSVCNTGMFKILGNKK